MAGRRPATLFYDADCGFCRAMAGIVLAWDRKERLRPVPLQDKKAADQLSDISEEERMASWHLVEPGGSRHSGGAALVPLFGILPRGRRLAQLAGRSPGATERVYRLAAENRDHLAKLVPGALQQRSERTLERRRSDQPPPGKEQESEQEAEPATGSPEPPGKDPGDISKDPSPHHALNNPVVDDPDPTEWPDPYDQRPDPRDPDDPDGLPFGEEPHPVNGAISTSEPHPSHDPEAERWEGPKRDKLDQ